MNDKLSAWAFYESQAGHWMARAWDTSRDEGYALLYAHQCDIDGAPEELREFLKAQAGCVLFVGKDDAGWVFPLATFHESPRDLMEDWKDIRDDFLLDCGESGEVQINSAS